jgi:hypothetical protein
MLGIIMFVTLVTEFFHLEEGQIEVTRDGIEALWVISEEYKVRKSGENCYDTIRSDRQEIFWQSRSSSGPFDTSKGTKKATEI